jgi:hypothetical protein
MSLESEATCGCDPCPVNLDAYGFLTEWEDPSFNGKKCLWHKQIHGTKGIISPDIDAGMPAIFVQMDDGKQMTVPVSKIWRMANRIGAKRI